MTYFFVSKMSPIGLIVTSLQDTENFILPYTSSDLKIRTCVEKMPIYPAVPSTLLNNFFSLFDKCAGRFPAAK